MKRDIFIDNDVAKNFSNPADPEYKRLIVWLKTNNKTHPDLSAFLVVSHKLIVEYIASTGQSPSNTCIPALIDLLSREGRLVRIEKKQLELFKRKHFKTRVKNSLLSNHKDHDHIPVVLLSDRKYALSLDNNFITDLLNFPGFTVRVEKRPEDLPYSS